MKSAKLTQSLGLALLMIISAIVLTSLAPTYLSRETALRINGALMGVMLAFLANAVPKTLPSLARLRCTPEQEQALRRFTGWAIVLGALGFSTAWLTVPFDYAALVAMLTLGTALTLVLVRVFRVRRRRSRGRG